MPPRAAAALFAALVTVGCAEPAGDENISQQQTVAAATSAPVSTAPSTTFSVDEGGAAQPSESTSDVPIARSFPLAKFEEMWDFEPGDEHNDAQMCGYLHIDVPHVYARYMEIGSNPDIPMLSGSLKGFSRGIESYRLILPRSGTRYDPQTRSLWVWDNGPMTDGHFVCGGGSATGYDELADDRPEHIPWNVTFMNREDLR